MSEALSFDLTKHSLSNILKKTKEIILHYPVQGHSTSQRQEEGELASKIDQAVKRLGDEERNCQDPLNTDETLELVNLEEELELFLKEYPTGKTTKMGRKKNSSSGSGSRPPSGEPKSDKLNGHLEYIKTILTSSKFQNSSQVYEVDRVKFQALLNDSKTSKEHKTLLMDHLQRNRVLLSPDKESEDKKVSESKPECVEPSVPQKKEKTPLVVASANPDSSGFQNKEKEAKEAMSENLPIEDLDTDKEVNDLFKQLGGLKLNIKRNQLDSNAGPSKDPRYGLTPSRKSTTSDHEEDSDSDVDQEEDQESQKSWDGESEDFYSTNRLHWEILRNFPAITGTEEAYEDARATCAEIPAEISALAISALVDLIKVQNDTVTAQGHEIVQLVELAYEQKRALNRTDKEIEKMKKDLKEKDAQIRSFSLELSKAKAAYTSTTQDLRSQLGEATCLPSTSKAVTISTGAIPKSLKKLSILKPDIQLTSKKTSKMSKAKSTIAAEVQSLKEEYGLNDTQCAKYLSLRESGLVGHLKALQKVTGHKYLEKKVVRRQEDDDDEVVDMGSDESSSESEEELPPPRPTRSLSPKAVARPELQKKKRAQIIPESLRNFKEAGTWAGRHGGLIDQLTADMAKDLRLLRKSPELLSEDGRTRCLFLLYKILAEGERVKVSSEFLKQYETNLTELKKVLIYLGVMVEK